jgi:hypothetical protein
MAGDSSAAGQPHVEIVLDYADGELAQFEALMARHQAAADRPRIWEGWPAFIALGLAAATGATLLAIAGGAVQARSGAGIAVLAFASYWIGLTAPALAGGVAAARRRKAAFDAFRAEWNGTRLLVTRRGIWLRRVGMRGYIGRDALRSTSRDDALFLLHLHAGAPTAIPLRLLTPAQQAVLAALPHAASEEKDRAGLIADA